jgi:disulfide bond formation protein DsbB
VPDAPEPRSRAWGLLLLAWLVALAATVGALFLGEVMGMTPCVLCWYQRIGMFPLALVLGIACYADDRRGAVYALALAAAGMVVAGYHTLLVAGLTPKAWVACGAAASCADENLAILGGVQIPWLSLAAFALIVGLLAVYLRKTSQ